MECIICFEDLNIKDIIQMDCCKQTIHKHCIKYWTENNIDKISDINYCFYCKQKNNTTDYIINLIKNETNDSIIEINNNSIEINNIIEINNNNIIERHYNVYSYKGPVFVLLTILVWYYLLFV